MFLTALMIAVGTMVVEAAKCNNCRWITTYTKQAAVITDYSFDSITIPLSRYGIDQAPVILDCTLACGNETVGFGSMGIDGLVSNGAQTISSGYIQLKLWGILEISQQTLQIFGTPNGCDAVTRTFNLTTTNPKGYIESVVLLNGTAWSPAEPQRVIFVKPGTTLIFGKIL